MQVVNLLQQMRFNEKQPEFFEYQKEKILAKYDKNFDKMTFDEKLELATSCIQILKDNAKNYEFIKEELFRKKSPAMLLPRVQPTMLFFLKTSNKHEEYKNMMKILAEKDFYV